MRWDEFYAAIDLAFILLSNRQISNEELQVVFLALLTAMQVVKVVIIASDVRKKSNQGFKYSFIIYLK